MDRIDDSTNDIPPRFLLGDDRLLDLSDGYYAIVDHQAFGPYQIKGYAKVCFEIEQLRSQKRKDH